MRRRKGRTGLKGAREEARAGYGIILTVRPPSFPLPDFRAHCGLLLFQLSAVVSPCTSLSLGDVLAACEVD
jgi:hypothetical protein